MDLAPTNVVITPGGHQNLKLAPHDLKVQHNQNCDDCLENGNIVDNCDTMPVEMTIPYAIIKCLFLFVFFFISSSSATLCV